MTDSPKFEFDRLKIYFGEPHTVKHLTGEFQILQPTLGDILELGENTFYQTLYMFIGNPTMYRLQLWDMGRDWNKISDYELFCALVSSIKSDEPNLVLNLLFKNIDFRLFEQHRKKLNGEETITLYSPTQDIEIDEEVYKHIVAYLRLMFNIYPKVEKAKGKFTKQSIIDEDREKFEKNKNKDSSTLLPLVSSCVNHPGFKYKLQELKEIGFVQFMDSVQRLQIYESTKALNSGMYSGMCDLSKVDKNLFNFMRDIDIK